VVLGQGLNVLLEGMLQRKQPVDACLHAERVIYGRPGAGSMGIFRVASYIQANGRTRCSGVCHLRRITLESLGSLGYRRGVPVETLWVSGWLGRTFLRRVVLQYRSTCCRSRGHLDCWSKAHRLRVLRGIEEPEGVLQFSSHRSSRARLCPT
jgi:hypothetical protein